MTIEQFRAIGSNSPFEQFPEIPAELLIDNDPMDSPPSQSFGSYSDDENAPSETREITLEEFSAMLHKDPSLVAELAEQFGVETTDPQEIVDLVIAQMQQQVPPSSGDLSPHSEESATANSQLPTPNSQLPPPPPAPKLEYKPEDPWNADRAANSSEELLPEAINMPDRGV